jgi:hypothetical protein
MPKALPFALYVSAIAGQLVPRPGSDGRDYFGARVTSPEDRLKGAEAVVWDEDRVIPITPEVAASNIREFGRWFANGSLKKRTAEDYTAWLKLEEKREAEHDAKLKIAAAAAAKPETSDESKTK